jgi:hypothetical protein
VKKHKNSTSKIVENKSCNAVEKYQSVHMTTTADKSKQIRRYYVLTDGTSGFNRRSFNAQEFAEAVRQITDRKFFWALDNVQTARRPSFNACPLKIADGEVKSQQLANSTKTLKLSGNMVDGTDRDLLGNPTLEGDASPRTQPRHICIAAITDDARTISEQIWTDDVDVAHLKLESWLDEAAERHYGRISLAMIHDPLTGSIRYRRHGEKLYVIEA